MADPAIPITQFNDVLDRSMRAEMTEIELAILRQSCAAFTKMHSLAGDLQPAIDDLTTAELMAFAVIQPAIASPILIPLLVSSICDGRVDILQAALNCQIIPDWPWLRWAACFSGEARELREELGKIVRPAERAAAACLATMPAVTRDGITQQLLESFFRVETARAFLTLLGRVLPTPWGSDIALWALGKFWDDGGAVLFAGTTRAGCSVDAVLAPLVAAVDPRHDITEATLSYADVIAHETNLALALRLFESGQYARARGFLVDLAASELCPAYDEAQRILSIIGDIYT